MSDASPGMDPKIITLDCESIIGAKDWIVMVHPPRYAALPIGNDPLQ